MFRSARWLPAIAAVAFVVTPPLRLTADDSGSESDKSYKELVASYQQATQSFFERYSKAKSDDERQTLLAEYPARTFAKRFFEFAESHAKEKAGIQAYCWLVNNAQQDFRLRNRALEVLTKEHAASEFLDSSMLARLGYARTPPELALLNAVVEKNKQPQLRGQALLSSATASKYQGNRKEAERILERVIQEYASGERSNKSLADRARGELFEIRNLSVGKTAPDIEGKDLDGVDFKLSDYRGKVVVLDFWGHW